jgi:hypothetical protein
MDKVVLSKGNYKSSEVNYIFIGIKARVYKKTAG